MASIRIKKNDDAVGAVVAGKADAGKHEAARERFIRRRKTAEGAKK